MAPTTIDPLSLPSEPTVAFKDSSFFSRNPTHNLLPSLSEVIERSVAQNDPKDHQKPRPTPVYFESLGVMVKFSRYDMINISEGQCLWALGRLLPEVPVPEIYGWSTEGGYVLLYMEIVKGVTVEKRWPSMTKEEKKGFWSTLKSLVLKLRTLSQDPEDCFLGTSHALALLPLKSRG